MNVPKSQVGTASERLTAVFKKPGNLTCSPDYNKNIKFLRGHTTLAIFYCSASTSDTLPKQEVIEVKIILGNFDLRTGNGHSIMNLKCHGC
jgi:hypothetical protein